MNPPAIFFGAAVAKNDPALQTRGDRKLLVTEIYPAKEEPVASPIWDFKSDSGKCPVVVMPDTEFAIFTQAAKQTRHCHKIGTEIYLLIEGRMGIEVEGAEYSLSPGDAIVVTPGAFHEIRREGEFLCRVITVNCGGGSDRFDWPA